MKSFIQQLALAAGRICRQEQERLTAEDLAFKSAKDLVTVTDRQVEAYLVEQIRAAFPDHGVLGEETGATAGSGAFRWIIDPIDGTTSYFHKQLFYAVSIALEKEGEVILGAVYAPALDQLFFAEKGKGAELNRTPIRVSRTGCLVESVMATGFACLRAGLETNNLALFNAVVPQLRDIRRYGSAALDLCYVAAGRLDGFWELNLNTYDVAAGALILAEAGGLVTDLSGGTGFPENGIAAANPLLHPLLLQALACAREPEEAS